MALILTTGYEDIIRSKFGVDSFELPDADINQPTIFDLAEAVVIKRVADYASITDVTEKIFLQNAVASYACYLLTPSMPRRLNVEVGTLDTKWKRDRVNWDAMAQRFLLDFENSLNNITSVEVTSLKGDYQIGGLITHERDTI